ncbi:hypothetical protein [Kribbella soli]|uniref:Uncharacterized protein n=1 Tax=Kribbella soli TaxID=1124743 RepID=A0A4R0H7P1_9ACTN|nr:hypothetical protein [Kribbella soli]TCC05798.1 hypothetical protein E0H45_27750 [Kribbella soli]
MTSRDRRSDNHQEVSSSRPQEPESWRDVVRGDYNYPDELDDLDRRSRRRAKKSWRRDDYAQRMAWMRRQRQAEPTSPLAIVVVVLLLAIIVLGFGGGLPSLLGRDEPKSGGVGLLTPSAPAAPAAGETQASTTSAGTAGTPTVIAPPPLTERPSPAATAAADSSARSWAQMFYTRNPAAESYDALVTKASRFTTSDVSDSLRRAGDSTYDALKTSQGMSRVSSIDVKPPKADSAPVDTPSRITRLVTVTIDVTGKQPQRIVLPLLLTLAFDGNAWVVSDIDGGTGP